MFDKLFTKSYNIEKYRAGPLVEPRERYLRHLAEAGASRHTLRQVALDQLRASRSSDRIRRGDAAGPCRNASWHGRGPGAGLGASAGDGDQHTAESLGDISGPVTPTESELESSESSLSIAPSPVPRTALDEGRASTFAELAEGKHWEDVTPDPDRFFELEYAPTLRRLIHRIVDRDGPVTLHGLARQIAHERGWQRTGRRIQAQVQGHLRSVERHREFETDFVWTPGSHSDRVPFRGLNGRPIREISRTEIASVIDAHVRDLENEADPILALARLLGITRLSKDARAYLSDCTRWRAENVAEEGC